MIKNIISIIIIFCFPCILFAENIVLKSGKTIEAKIVKKAEDYIKIKFNTVELTYFYSDIESIDGVKLFQKQQSPNLQKDYSLIDSLNAEMSANNIFKKVSPAVVSIAAIYPESHGYGEGFIIREEGLVVTNFHVVAGAERIFIKLYNGIPLEVISIIRCNPKKDICILKVDGENLPIVTINSTKNFHEGQKVYAIDTSRGFHYKIAEGKFIRKQIVWGEEFIQSDVPFTFGNSGGALFDDKGNAIGIIAWVQDDLKSDKFAIPINEIDLLLEKNEIITISQFKDKYKDYIFYNEGTLAKRQRNIEFAMQLFQRAIYINPNLAQAHKEMGDCYRDIDMLDEAIVEYDKALSLFSSEASIYDGLARVYVKKGLFDKGVSSALKGIEMNPYATKIYECLGWAYFMKNMHEEAIKALRRGLELEPTYCSLYSSLAYVYFDWGDYEAARGSYNYAISMGCEMPSDLVNKLNLY